MTGAEQLGFEGIEAPPDLRGFASPAIAALDEFLQSTVVPLYDSLEEEDYPGRPDPPRVLQQTLLWLASLLTLVTVEPPYDVENSTESLNPPASSDQGNDELDDSRDDPDFDSFLALFELSILEMARIITMDISLSEESVIKTLGLHDSGVLDRIFEIVRAILRQRLAPLALASPRPLAGFATGVVAIDVCTLDELVRKFASPEKTRNEDVSRLPGGLAGLFDVRTQLWRAIFQVDGTSGGRRSVTSDLVAELPQGTLIQATAKDFDLTWFDELTDKRLYWTCEYRARTATKVLHTFFAEGDTSDVLVQISTPSTGLSRHPVRLVDFQAGGKRFRFVTNVTDPVSLPIAEIARLYARHWDIARAVDFVKSELHLAAYLSRKKNVIWYQVWGALIVSQIIQALRWEIAIRARVDPLDVSLTYLISSATQSHYSGKTVVELFVDRRFNSGYIRPSKRRPIEGPSIPPEKYLPLSGGVG